MVFLGFCIFECVCLLPFGNRLRDRRLFFVRLSSLPANTEDRSRTLDWAQGHQRRRGEGGLVGDLFPFWHLN